MNRHVVTALLEDAYRQVIDDKVFRLLVVVAVLMIAPTLAVSVRPEGVSFLFGWKSVTYEELFRAFGQPAPSIDDLHVLVVQSIQEITVQGLAGTVGLFFCIGATAFFVPRMLEKGAADTLFSKPVGRFALLLARYAAGVVFVGILSFLLVLGMHLGFLISSGYSDPAFLWSALTLTYVFALIHSVSVLVAVLTRSSIAAILCALVFFSFTGCVHQAWYNVEHGRAITADREARGDVEESRAPERFVLLRHTFDGLHFLLPKTTDADFIVRALRRSVSESAPGLLDANELLAVTASPPAFEREGPEVVDLKASSATWIARDGDGRETARIALSRLDRRVASDRQPEDRPRLRTPGSMAAERAKAIEQSGAASDKPARSSRPSSDELEFAWVAWRERDAEGEVDRRQGFTGLETWTYAIDASFRPGFGAADERDRALERFVKALRVERKRPENLSAEAWYAQALSWSAPPRLNTGISIASSLAFAAVMLLLARWRLARVDF